MNHRSNNSVFQYNVLTGLIILSLQSAYAGVVRDDVDYQQFRDFAENKGKFAVGKKDTPIPILGKNGEQIGTIFGNGISMPDFSFADRNTAITSLVHPQYVASVAHNSDRNWGGVNNVYEKLLKQQSSNAPTFGGQNVNPDANHFSYHIIDRNDPPKYYDDEEKDERGSRSNSKRYDYNMPRLFKMVTEVVPIPISNIDENKDDYKDKNLFPELARLGSGNQFVFRDGMTAADYEKCGTSACISIGYKYLTGGVGFNIGEDKKVNHIKNFIAIDVPIQDSPFSNFLQLGDSGSPMLIFDKQQNKWVLFATFKDFSVYDFQNRFTLTKQSYLDSVKQDDIGGILNNQRNGNSYDWSNQVDAQNELKQSVIKSSDGLVNLILDVKIENDETKNWQDHNGLIFKIQNQLDKNKTNTPQVERQLLSDIRKYFNHGKNLTISGEKGILNLKSDINQGAGALYFETDFTVKADNPDTTWLGAGISVAKGKTVDWQIKNPKDDRLSKIGEGTLLVNGTGNNEGDISVGDGLVILSQKDGQAFNQVGIVSGRPTVKLENDKQLKKADDIYFGYRGGRLDVNGNNLTFDYIRNVDEGAKIVNHNKAKPATITIKTDAKDENKSAFNGVFGETNTDFFGNPLENKKHNGELNVVYSPENAQENKFFLLSGGTNLNGNLTVENGNVLLSGRPTPHAYDHIKKEEPFQDNDWINRTFNASNIVVQENSKLTVGRNVAALNANIVAQNNSTIQLGFVDGKTPVCVRSDYLGSTTCDNKHYQNQSVLDSIPRTQMQGDLTLASNANVLLGKTGWAGKSASEHSSSQLTLSPEARWTMTGNSSVGHLAMEKGSQITLNSGFEKDNQTNQFNTLTIQGDLSGEGQFNYLTNIAGKQGDKVVVEGIASGSYILNVKDSGQEPKGDDLVLMNLTNQNQSEAGLNVQLNNANKNGQDYVDWGAWRYDLKRQNNQFVLVGKNTQPQNDTNSTTGNTTTGNTTTGNTTTGNTTTGNTTTGNTTTGNTTTGNTTTGNTTTGNATTSNNTTMVSVPIVPDSPVVPTQPTQVIVPSAQSISKYTNLALSGRLATLETNIKTLEPINQRLLDIHAKSRGIWVHHESAKQKNQSEYYRGYQQKHHLFQLGVDKETDLANGKLLLGVALSNTNSEQTFDEGYGDSRLILGGLYGRWLSPNRSWIAFDAGYGVAKHKLVLDNQKVAHNQNMAHLGVKVGKTWQLGALEIQPSLGARYHSLSNGRYQLDGANIQYGKWNAMAYQPELRLNYSFKTASGLELNPYLSTSYLYLSGRSHVDVNAYRFSLPMNRTLQNQAGVSIQKGKWHGKMYLNHERGKQTKGRSVGLMLNYEW